MTLIDRTHYGGGDREDRRGAGNDVVTPDRLTDISGAIDFAARLLALAPHTTRRAVMSICANGIDNFKDGTESSRNAALTQGFTINGLVLGQDEKLARYFRSSAIGGPGAFVMKMSDPNDAGDFMTRKLVRDLMVSAQTDHRKRRSNRAKGQ